MAERPVSSRTEAGEPAQPPVPGSQGGGGGRRGLGARLPALSRHVAGSGD